MRYLFFGIGGEVLVVPDLYVLLLILYSGRELITHVIQECNPHDSLPFYQNITFPIVT